VTALQSDAHGPGDLDRTGTTSSVAKRNLSEPFSWVPTVEYKSQSADGCYNQSRHTQRRGAC